MTLTPRAIVAMLALVAFACGGDPEPDPDPPDPAEPTSPKANVKIKNGQRLQKELARTLDLAPGEVCRELGLYDCFGIHSVVLGNTDAFGSGLYEPLPSTTSTSPIAVERVVLAGCTERVARDFDDPGAAVIFRNLPIGTGRALADVDDPAVTEAIDTLYRRALSRRAKPAEIDHLKQLYRDVEASPATTAPANEWATLSCFAVLTTMEAIFY